MARRPIHKVTFLPALDSVQARKSSIFLMIAPARPCSVQMPGRIGFMSTQRREARWQPAGCARSARKPGWSLFSLGSWLALVVVRAVTARPDSTAKLATNSLPEDYLPKQLVRQQLRRCGAPPGSGGLRTASRTPAARRSSLSRFSTLSRLASHPSCWPQAPVIPIRRAERYDGKGNLHFIHAA